MCVALARACGGSPAWALALLHDHPRTFDAFWNSSFAPSAGAASSPAAADARAPAACDIDGILGRT